jgi:hypothetical protein
MTPLGSALRELSLPCFVLIAIGVTVLRPEYDFAAIQSASDSSRMV